METETATTTEDRGSLAKPIDLENLAWLAVRMAERRSFHDLPAGVLH